jgi:hypothetical protein
LSNEIEKKYKIENLNFVAIWLVMKKI